MYSKLHGSNTGTLKVFALLFTCLFVYYIVADKSCGALVYQEENLKELKSFESSQLRRVEEQRSDRRIQGNKGSKGIDLSKGIAILIVLTKDANLDYYNVALKSVECYSKVQGYTFIVARDNEYDCEENKDKFFRRHCVTSKILPKYSAVLFLDADIGVVNPKKRIEDFLDANIDVTFYDRNFNFEIMAGSYLARNTPYAIELIRDFGNYEFKLPNSFHGTDNGAIHMFLAEKLFPKSTIEINLCRKAYNHSKNFDDLGIYTACMRTIFGASTDFGKVRILKKLEGWARDDWLTSGLWNEEVDFMLHGWKTDHMKSPRHFPLQAVRMSMNEWYNPLAGPISLERCTPGNTTWSYVKELVATREAVWKGLKDNEMSVANDKIKLMGKISSLMERNDG